MEFSSKKNWFSTSLFKGILSLHVLVSLTSFAVNPNQLSGQSFYNKNPYFFLTFQSAYITLFVVSIGFLIRALPVENKFSSILKKIYNKVLPVAISLEIFVTVFFWTAYFYDSRILYSSFFRKPENMTYLITELGQHLSPLLLLGLEQINFAPQNATSTGILLAFYLMCYGTLLKIVASYHNNRYPYPFISNLKGGVDELVLIIVFCGILYSISRVYMYFKAKDTAKPIFRKAIFIYKSVVSTMMCYLLLYFPYVRYCSDFHPSILRL